MGPGDFFPAAVRTWARLLPPLSLKVMQALSGTGPAQQDPIGWPSGQLLFLSSSVLIQERPEAYR